MNRNTAIALVLTALSMPLAAEAVPLQIAHQGELSDADGPITDSVSLTFKLFDTATGGTESWSETRTVDVVAGHYAVLLGGATQSNPIEDVLLQEPALFLEITFEAEAPLLPRQPVGSTPYAIHAYTAENVVGGTVDAASLSVNGTAVVNGTGQWVGPAGSIDWTAVTGAPADADTLAGLACADGSVAKYVTNTGQWTCASDVVLSAAEVLGYLAGATVDFGTGSSMAGVDLATVDDIDWSVLGGVPAGFADDVDDDALGGLSCGDGSVVRWSSGSGLWECQADLVLTSTQVRSMVEGAQINLAAGSQIGGAAIAATSDLTWTSLGGVPSGFADDVDNDTVAGLSCSDGSVAKYVTSSGQWGCASDIVLSAAQVLGYVNGATVNLGAGSQMAGVDIATMNDLAWGSLAGIPAGFADDSDADTLDSLICTNGQVAAWNASTSAWGCTGTAPVLSRTSFYMRTGVDPDLSQDYTGAVALCDDANDVPITGGCRALSDNLVIRTFGPTDDVQIWDAYSMPVPNWPTGSDIGGWGCRAHSGLVPTNLTAYVVCLDIP